MALLEHWGPPVIRLADDERMEVYAEASDARIVVTDRRLIIASERRLTLDIAIEQIRRVEFDVEKGRSAMLVIVSDAQADQPQILVVEAEQFEEIARVVSVVGGRLRAVAAAPMQDAAEH